VLINVWTTIVDILDQNLQTEFKHEFYLGILYMKPCRTNYSASHSWILVILAEYATYKSYCVLINVWTTIIDILDQSLQREFKHEFYLRILYMKPCRTNYSTTNNTWIL